MYLYPTSSSNDRKLPIAYKTGTEQEKYQNNTIKSEEL